MEFTKEANRIYAADETGNIIAEVTFPNAKDGVVSIDHTFVSPTLRGQGVASQLIDAAYETIKAGGRKAYAACSYAVTWFDEHPEKQDILAGK
jgi:predicted GNAT family acetyltransferase